MSNPKTPNLGNITILRGEHSLIATNGKLGGWVKSSKNSYVSIEYAKTLNRQQRRKQGIVL